VFLFIAFLAATTYRVARLPVRREARGHSRVLRAS
jgi:hypothetical protein